MIILADINAVKTFEMMLLLLLALVGDLRAYKIKNSITFFFAMAGAVTNFALGGTGGLWYSLIGMVTPIIILFFFFAASMLGAGDIKLFSALGAITGYRQVLFIIVCSFFTGAVIAIVLMIMRKNTAKRFRHLIAYFKTCILTFTISPYTDMADKADGAKFRFVSAIALGSIISLLMKKYML